MRLASKIVATVLLLLALGQGGLAQSASVTPRATAMLDTTLILIGDHVTLQIDVEGSDSAFVQFPVYTDTIVKNVEILKDLPFDTIRENGQVTIRKRYVMTSFDSGYYFINPIAVTLRYKTKPAETIFTNPMFLGVQTIQIDSTETRMADIKKPMDTPLTTKEFFSEYFPYVVVFAVLVILVFLVLWLLKQRKNTRTEPVIEIPREEAHVIALRELDQLAEKKLWQSGLVKNFYSDLSEILRRYLEHRYKILALESSTTDIALIFKSQKIVEKELQQKLMDFLETADLVKFAKFEPLASEHLKFMEQSYNFVLKTKVEVIPDEEKNEDDTSVKDTKPEGK
jgi:hypothetical protein